MRQSLSIEGGCMQINYLQEFLILEKTRNFSKASKLLHISQSALSKHIAALEDELDVDLFKRLGNTLQLTDAGAVFRDGALVVVNDHNSLLARMKAIRQRSNARLKIGYLPAVASFLMGPLHEWLSKNAPEVHLEIQSMDVTNLYKSLIDREVDYAVSLDFTSEDEELSSYPIYDEEFFLVLPSNHRFAEQTEITRVELGSEAFLIPGTELPELSRKLDNALGMLASYRNGTIYRDVNAVLDMVSAGRGVAMAGGHNAAAHPSLVFRRLSDLQTPVTVPVSLIWLAEREKYRAIARHIAMLEAAIDNIRGTEAFTRGAVLQ